MRDIAAKVQDATPCQLAGKVMEAVNKKIIVSNQVHQQCCTSMEKVAKTLTFI